MLKQYVLLAAVAICLYGCASVPMGDTNKDAALKTFAVKPDVASVYIYRNGLLDGPNLRMNVQVDGKPLGQTVPKVYLYTEISPEKHVITSTTVNLWTGNPVDDSDNLELEAVAGKRYYIWQEWKSGFLVAHVKLHLVDESEGQKVVLENKLAVKLADPQ